MNRIFCLLFRALQCPFFAGAIIIGVSVTSLALAYVAEYGFGMLPCILCLYQRIPFVIAIVFGVGILGFSKAQKWCLSAGLIALTGVTFLANSALAFYHSGVERKWWTGFEGCSAPDLEGLSGAELMAAIKATPAVRCDEIPWEMFGLSMANYNVVYCLGLGVVCLFIAVRVYLTKFGSGSCPR